MSIIRTVFYDQVPVLLPLEQGQSPEAALARGMLASLDMWQQRWQQSSARVKIHLLRLNGTDLAIRSSPL